MGLLAMGWTTLAAEPDILIADFESASYGDWKAEGEAFGDGPARGQLPGQMPVDGHEGNGLVNSFLRGDDTTGTLTSPAFKIQRRNIRFLVGGGNHPKETCINLVIKEKIVRTTTGPDSEHLDWQQWDVAEFAGQEAVIQIVDQRKGGWGHINVDHILQTDKALPRLLANPSRELTAAKKYLHLPVKNGATKRLMTVSSEGRVAQQFTIELADGPADWWAFLDISGFRGKPISITVDHLKEDSTGLTSIAQADQVPDAENLYSEKLRPQFHFSARRGWLNDPNGLVEHDGEYHLFFQHNPYGWNWGNMHWGHAVSRDLVHWEEIEEALYPDEMGTMFSGSAVVDENNTAGLQKGIEKTLVALYTAAGGENPMSKGKKFTQCLAYSNDRGRTWTKYEKNPILPHIVAQNRDPKVIWFAPQNKWVMALYLDKDDFALFDSTDLKAWRELQRISIKGSNECPEFFEIGVEGKPGEKRWILYGANGLYLVGSFDGKQFTPEAGPLALNSGNCFYASQIFNLAKNNPRRILIPWGQISLPGMPFNQMMGLPVELKLRPSGPGVRLTAEPVRELEKLRQAPQVAENEKIGGGRAARSAFKSALWESQLEITPEAGSEIRIELRGVTVAYDAAKQEISCLGKKAALPLVNGKIRLRLLVDRTSIDIFGNDGAVYMPMGFVPKTESHEMVISSGKGAVINRLENWELKSAWKR